MNFALLLLAVTVLGSLAAGGVLMVLGLRSAPDGYEDENGFHPGKPAQALVPVAADNFAVCLDRELAYSGR